MASLHRRERLPLEPVAPAIMRASLGHLVLALLVWYGLASYGSRAASDETSITRGASTVNSERDRLWFNPSHFRPPVALTLHTPASRPSSFADTPSSTPAAAAPSPDLARPRVPAPSQAKSRIITLSRLPATTAAASTLQLPPAHEVAVAIAEDYTLAGSKPSVSAGTSPDRNTRPTTDPAALAVLDRLDEALYEAFMQAWQPPDPLGIPSSKRSARLDVTLDFAANLVAYELSQPSGSTDLDLSIMQAADHVRDRLRLRHHRRDALKFPQELPSTFRNSGYVCRIQFQIE